MMKNIEKIYILQGEYGPGSPPSDPMGMAAHGYDGATPSELKPFSPNSNNNMDTTVGPPPHVQPVHYQDSPNHVSFIFEVFSSFLGYATFAESPCFVISSAGHH